MREVRGNRCFRPQRSALGGALWRKGNFFLAEDQRPPCPGVTPHQCCVTTAHKLGVGGNSGVTDRPSGRSQAGLAHTSPNLRVPGKCQSSDTLSEFFNR